jgi:hypothetical protein
MKTIRAMIYKRPWLLVVFFLGFMVALSLTFVMIAVLNPPDLI